MACASGNELFQRNRVLVLVDSIQDPACFVYNETNMSNLSTGNLSPVSSLQVSKTHVKHFKHAVNMLDLREMSDGARHSIMMTMDELQKNI